MNNKTMEKKFSLEKNNTNIVSNDINNSNNNNPNNANNKNNIDISHYDALSGQSMQKLGFGFWFVKNKKYLFLALVAILILISLIFYSKFFVGLYRYVRGIPEERKVHSELSSNLLNLNPDRGALDLQQGTLSNFFVNNAYDFVINIKNPNNNFIASISYCFVDGAEELSCSSDIIFPEENKYLISLSNKLEKRPSDLKFNLKSVAWERVHVRKYGDWNEYYNSRLNFTISELKFNKSISVSNINDLSFVIRNNSAYNYWEVPLKIILLNGNLVVGVNSYLLSEMMSLESRNVSFSWPGVAGGVNKVEIIPDLNILDANNYINYR